MRSFNAVHSERVRKSEKEREREREREIDLATLRGTMRTPN